VPKRDDDYLIAKRNFNAYTRGRDAGHTEYVEDALKFDRFYAGEQWDPADLAKLKEEGRPALTNNMIMATINVLLGEQQVRRADLRFKPGEGASPDGAEGLNKLWMAVSEANGFDDLESDVFSDGIISERGYFDLRMDWNRKISGEIKIDVLDPLDVILPKDAKRYDPNEWPEITVSRWYSLDEIESQFGLDKREEVEDLAQTATGSFGSDSILFGQEETTPGEMQTPVDDEDAKFVRKVRAVDRQYKKLVPVYCLIDADTGNVRELHPKFDREEKVKALADKLGVIYFKKSVEKIRWTVTVDTVVLHDDWSEYRSFSIIPYFPYFRRGRPMGPIRNLISPQEQHNKLISQELHVVNTTANSGWIVETGALNGMTADELRQQGSKSGVVIEVNPNRKVEKIKPNQIPSGLDRIANQSKLSIREISGINNAMLGLEGAEVSGVALEGKKNSGQLQLQVPLENLSRTRRLIGAKVVELVQDFMPDERTISFSDVNVPGQPNSTMTLNKETEQGTENDVASGEMRVVVTTMPNRVNLEEQVFAEMISMRRENVMIPDHHIIMNSSLQNKEAIAQEVKQLSGLGEPSPEQQEQQAKMEALQMQLVEAELMDKQASAEAKKGTAALSIAKANEVREKLTTELDKMDHSMQMSREGLELRERLALLANDNKIRLQQMKEKADADKTIYLNQLPEKGEGSKDGNERAK